MMKNTVYEEWLDYVSDGNGKNYAKFLDIITKNFKGFGFGTEVCECCGNVSTFFQIELADENILYLPAYGIGKSANGKLGRDIVKTNFEIYLNLLWKLFGPDKCKSFDVEKSYGKYVKRIEKLMIEAFGKLPEDWEV